MNIKQFAESLNGREYGREITRDEEQQAKTLGYVVVFGSSDDNMAFRGAIYDEVGCYGGGVAYLTETGLFDPCGDECESECKYYIQARDRCKTIKAFWDVGLEYAWHYETDIPHETFDICEDGEKFCRGIVFRVEDLKG